jgi:Acetyltransferase (GNAT) domain
VSGAAGQDVRITTVRTLDEAEALRDEWIGLLDASITTHPDYYRAVIETEPHVQAPYLLALHRDGKLEAMLLGRLEEIPLTCRLGYRTVYAPRVRSITIVYEGYVGRVDDETAPLLLDELRSAIDRGDADVLLFRHLNVEHPLRHAATDNAGFLRRQHLGRTTICWERTLPGSYEEFMQSLSKSTRSGVRRYEKKLERDFEGRLEVRTFREVADLDDFYRDAEVVAAKSYQRGLGAGVRDEERQRRRATIAAAHGWFRAYILYLDGAPVAFCGGEGFRGRFRYGIPGYDPALGDYRVGTYVLMRMIEDLCADETISLLDFGFGDAEYKRRFGDRSWFEGDVLLYARRLRPAWINVARTSLLGVNAAAMALGKRAGVFGRIKNRWRSRLRTVPER